MKGLNQQKSWPKSELGEHLAAKIRVSETSNVVGFELWARLKPSKGKFRFGCSRISQWTRENPVFTATRCSEINGSGHFLLVQTFSNQVLFE
jgi:hypothetical protein